MADPPQNEEAWTVSESQTVPGVSVGWDDPQWDVIDSPPEDRLLVSAGPGTGKTAVACARVSHLVDQYGLEPSRIWLISFTRTAVREIRNRTAACLEDAGVAYAVKIATLDSHAWAIHSGFDGQARILGLYEENIESVLGLVRKDGDVSEYLNEVEHLIVDEAQDIVGIRAELVTAMIRQLSATCGVTVFADEAQAIYGFAEENEVRAGAVREPPLPERIRGGAVGSFRTCELTKVYRTESRRLQRIFTEVRHTVLTGAGEKGGRLDEVRRRVRRLAHGKAPDVDDKAVAKLDDAFILYRRRCDVLLAASFLAGKGIPHRVRMSGLPACLAPWIGATLSEHTVGDLSRDDFAELWSSRIHGTSLGSHDSGEAWEHLVRIAGRTRTVVDMRLLRQRLGRKQPPAELCAAELGHRGPIVGTIHASKGREAETVHLMLPKTTGGDTDENEEARVVFVGATRGRSTLLVGTGFAQASGRIEKSGRVYSLKTENNRARAQIEVGQDSDILAEGLAGRRFFGSAMEVRTSQERLRSLADSTVPVVAEADRQVDFSYRLSVDGQNGCLAVLSQHVNVDLFVIADAVRKNIGGRTRRPPDRIPYLYTRGVRTIVLPPAAPETELLHEPWRSSGIILAPLVFGYTTVTFPSRSRQ